MKKNKLLLITLALFTFIGCSSDDINTKYVPPATELSNHPNDVFLRSEIFNPYGTAVRWKWDDRFISDNQKATPIKSDLVIPVAKLLKYLWIEAYSSNGEGGKKFIEKLIPSELQFIGSYIYNDDGTVLLGYAEGGARISILNLNSYDLTDRDWLTNPGGGVLATIHHEFSHIVHQNYGIPVGFNTISEAYLGAGWSNGVTRDDAIKLGMVRNYGTLNEFEDFAEIISHFLTLPKATFEEDFINQQDCNPTGTATGDEILECYELNQGRLLIKQKLDLIIDFYKTKFDIDLVKLRDDLEVKIDYVVTNNKIPN
ncbi:substrate import-associated zinc metallohydrolase lipoprotein [Flavobacterium sp. 7E]|uniref:substrate import-associated zinc metallohydrolase lipoprotein n=1 Tax=Flavobacterium sp. 7E TaxID=2735898 RepID=UPI00157045CB|nr:substrate import-associated zinc metallohydrolase lipoprotein [Flavobacterium sp. 7E]NRS89213.1 substrate import-associated zinc metallohydrolase lipoprotein [Flavobacterium sp. 7E]